MADLRMNPNHRERKCCALVAHRPHSAYELFDRQIEDVAVGVGARRATVPVCFWCRVAGHVVDVIDALDTAGRAAIAEAT